MRQVMGYRAGSPEADAAFERQRDRETDAHEEALYGDPIDEDAEPDEWEDLLADAYDPDQAYDNMRDERDEETWH